MSSLKISIITVTFNAADTIENCIRSVISQTYPNVEYIIVDGLSTDTSLAIIDKYKKHVHHIISEPDNGIYHAMNKGISLATGDVIGMLNADDIFASNNILADVANAFTASGADIVYGDIDYIDKQSKIIRKWRSGKYKHGSFNWGWMPPHPSFYARRTLFEKLGAYRPQYGSATDYELMLRYIHTHKSPVYYLNIVMVKMLVGGVSNKSISNRFKAWRNDIKAMRNNGLLFPLFSIIWKPFRKIMQFIT
ncbi:glycosyltransferase [Mucilaginibacter mali]|uniref:Glycosyltransferase n=1 Tax=Mucilaginibacter mali TaxID=2740462 RepID=A0A7D4QBD2_9SPHI|nr:glycosyltransferase family 2 protein [Mucilaginibacter mali]QKJ30424.1 glycosyltransferase [Mucilaginibacter mali]